MYHKFFPFTEIFPSTFILLSSYLLLLSFLHYSFLPLFYPIFLLYIRALFFLFLFPCNIHLYSHVYHPTFFFLSLNNLYFSFTAILIHSFFLLFLLIFKHLFLLFSINFSCPSRTSSFFLSLYNSSSVIFFSHLFSPLV